jgi:hypothetical protein
VQAAFEEWEASPAQFHAVVSFAAFHWIEPGVRCAKAARLLNGDGSLAVFDWQDTRSDDGDDFFLAVEEDYAVVVPEWETKPPLTPGRVIGRVQAEIDASGWFAPAETRRYLWGTTYSDADYIRFLNTRSSYRLLDEARRSDLFGRIRARIAQRPSKSVRKEFLGTLTVARRLATHVA